MLGEPLGKVKGDGVVILLYADGGVELRNGNVARIDASLGRNAMEERRSERANSELDATDKLLAWAEKAKQSLWELLGQPASAEKASEPITVGPLTPGRAAVKKLSNGGQAIDLDRLLVKGQITIVDFYADWCGPCRRIGPKLELIATQDEHVYLRKVDIVRWGTDVATQFDISSIPSIRVYDRAGQMVGKPTSDFGQVTRYVALAK